MCPTSWQPGWRRVVGRVVDKMSRSRRRRCSRRQLVVLQVVGRHWQWGGGYTGLSGDLGGGKRWTGRPVR